MIDISPIDLSIAAGMVLLLAGLSWWLRLDIHRRIIIVAARTILQLTLIGYVLKVVFANEHVGWVLLIWTIMLLIASREVISRQRRRFSGIAGLGIGVSAMFVSSFAVTLVALLVIVDIHPWYTPQYAIPLMGMLLGNTMTGIALGLDRFTHAAWESRSVIEQRLLLGQTASSAMLEIQRDAIRSGLIPIINAMAAAGVVSLPGMMTGQILAGNSPLTAVKYQILIMLLISVGTGLGVVLSIWIARIRLFDRRQRLRLERLRLHRP